MSRSTHQRQQQKLQLQQQQQQLMAQQQQMAENDAAAAAAEMFDLFCVATTMRQVLGLHRNMCDLIGLRPAPLNEFYPKLKAKIRSWKAQALWKKFDARAAHRAYAKGNACTGARVLVIGAGPCGLRTAIEAQLLGAKVVVVEKRDRISRNNVLHLWPFVITDLRNLGAKKFYGKFCAGSIDHISIRQLQCILLKVALLLGVEVHEGVSFDGTVEPSDGCGWHASVTPTDHAVSHYEFDVLIGADGKRNTLEGFKRKEFRGKLAIAITANFINKKTEAEAKAEEISGVAFIFNQSFFKELYHTTGIDLENIVYYKDETHYFVMTAKKHSLIDKGVIMHDFADPAELLAPVNVNTEKLLDYAREAANFSTKYQMPNLEFAVNHYGKPDVAMFDFTSMFAAETSCRVIMRNGFRLLQCLVGDSLLEPFWPTGSGCARGFLSSMDAAYAIKLWSNTQNSTLGVLAQRESIYRLLNQTTPENLQRDIGSYTVDPASRYPNLNRTSVNVWQVKHLIDTDDPAILEQTFMDTNALQATQTDTTVRRKRRSGDSLPLSAVLLRWICAQLHSYDFTKTLKEVSDVFTNGKVLCALINRYRPDLVDFNAVKDLPAIECNDIAFKILEKELNIPRIMSGKDSMQLNTIELKLWLNYLEQICEVFRGEIPHVKHPKMDFTELREKYRFNPNVQPDFSKLLQISTKQKAKAPMQDMVDVPQPVRRSVLDEERLKRQRKHAVALDVAAVDATGEQQEQAETPRRAKKRRSAEKAANIEERQKRLQEIEENRQDRQSKRRQQRYQQTQNFYKSLHMLHANTLLRESDDTSPFEDYSIFLYRQQAPVFNDRVKELERKLLYPDRERSDIPSALPRNATDEQFSDRIKSMEQRITSRNNYGTEKKPKDLMRAIGKIDSSDWNVREIEKKIEQSKKTEINDPKGREKVPKWSKEQFMARQHKMSRPIRQDSGEEKFKEIDQTLKNFDKQLKEGSVLEVGERGRNKVASIAGQFVKKDDTSDEKNPPTTVVQKPSTKVALAFKKQAASEKCHFCKQIVYLMEKINTEGLILHRSCLKCHHCHTNLRPGGYAFDRDDPIGRFYCTQHFRLPAKAIRPVVRKPGQRKPTQQQQAAAAAAAVNTNDGTGFETPDKLRGRADSLAQLDLLDRGQTPERIEFENTDAMSDGEPSEEHIIDENEWSGRNFLPESNNDSESDLSSSDDSNSDSDSDIFEEANDSPLGVQTLQLATDWIGKQNYSDSDDSDDFYDSSDGMADDGKDDTEGEEFKKARELRREEVRLLPLPANLPTDTETEPKNNNENIHNKENTETATAKTTEQTTEQSEVTAAVSLNTETTDIGKSSAKTLNSEQSLISLVSTGPTPTTDKIVITKADMEKIERNSDRKFSAEIEEISEKLYRLNNMRKMTKDLESLAKENIVNSDILKKLTLKEKWLAHNNTANIDSVAPKSQFDLKIEKIFKSGTETTEVNNPKAETNFVEKTVSVEAKELPEHLLNINSKENNPSNNIPSATKAPISSPKQSPIAQRKNLSLSRSNSLKKTQKHLSPSASPQMEKKSSAASSRSNSFKSTASTSSPKLSQKSSNINLKIPERSTTALNESKMQLENILDIVKKIDISGTEKNHKKSPEMAHTESSDSDIGKLLYEAESKLSPKSNRTALSTKLKEIESKSFAGTMDTIKSQMVMPTVSAQAAPNVDLSKYFPSQKQEKANMSAINKNQKNLKDVDLTKYFPSSPVQQRRTTVVTVAEKLKRSKTEAGISPASSTSKQHLPAAMTVTKPKLAPKRQASLGDNPCSSSFSLREHQLDGALDLAKKKSSIVTTTNVTALTTKKGNVKIIKKIVPKGTKIKKSSETTSATEKTKNKSFSIIPIDESDRILDEILHSDNDHKTRSPSFEYKKLFDEEKSPSEDLSDKIERILEETGIDLGIARKKPNSDNKKKLLKAKSLGEGEFERNQLGKLTNAATGSLQSVNENDNNSGETKISGVQNILKRFESLSSVKSSNSLGGAFKLQRMESSTSNLNKSRESIVSRESDSVSDLEKTMEYLKSEWRNEATNFLQKKRDSFYAAKHSVEIGAELQKKSKVVNELPVQYRESKLAKFFGIKQKSPERKNTFLEKKKTPEKKKSPLRNKASPEKKTTSGKKTTSAKKNSPEKKTLTQAKVSVHRTIVPPQEVSEKSEVFIKPLQNKLDMEEREIVTLLDISQKTLECSLGKPNEKVVSKRTDDVFKLGSNNNKSQETNSEFLQTETHLPVSNSLLLNEINIVDKAAIFNDSNDKILLNHSTVKNSTDSVSVAKEITRNPSFDQSPQSTPAENRRPVVEDIKNLPKFGCDKCQSNSRRNSQSSLQDRRMSDGSLTDNLDSVTADKLSNKVNTTLVENHSVDVVDFVQISKQLEDAIKKESHANDEHQSSRSNSESSSAQPITVKLRGSSEEESIEKLFCQFSDDMLVDVEFDSNDDLIAITPRAVLLNNEEQNAADRDRLDRLESLENDDVTSITSLKPSLADNLDSKMQSILDKSQFPTRPQRRQKSSSTSSEPFVPKVPHHMKKKLEKLNPADMAPSVQDLMHDAFSQRIDNLQYVPITDATPLKFPHKFEEDYMLTELPNELHYLNSKKDSSKKEETAGNSSNERCPSKTSIESEIAFEVSAVYEDSHEESPSNMEEQSAQTTVNRDGKQPISVNIDFQSKHLNPDVLTDAEALETLYTSRPFSKQDNNRNIPSNLDQKNTISGKQGISIIENSTLDAQSPSETDYQLKLQILDSSTHAKPLEVLNKNIISDEKNNAKKGTQPITQSNVLPAQITNSDQMSINSNRSSSPPMFKTLEIPFAITQTLVTNDSQESNMEKHTSNHQRRLSGQGQPKYQAIDGVTDPEPHTSFNSSRRHSNEDGKGKITPLITSANLSPAQSMKFDQSSISSNRSGTPPMFKKLEITSDLKPTPQTSRRNSAVSALSDVASLLNLQPIYTAPMPKKLQIPMDVSQVDNNANESIAKVFKNKSWSNSDVSKAERSTSFGCDEMSDLTIKEKELPRDDNILPPQASSEKADNTIDSNFSTIIVNKSQNDLKTNLTSTSKRRNSNDSISSKSNVSADHGAQSEKVDLSNVNATSTITASKAQSKEKSLDWDMEKMPASPIPRRKLVREFKASNAPTLKLRHSNDSLSSKNDEFSNSAVESQKLDTPIVIATFSKDQSKEKSLDWDMEKMPASPMPRRKFMHAERAPYQETYIRDVSPTSSLKILNNLPQNNVSVEEKEKRLIEDFESERRQALNKRDKEYQEKHKLLKLSNTKSRNPDLESISMKGIPLMTSGYSSTAGSIISDQVQSDSESSSSNKVEQNSATEISTDSEFDHDEIIRETPKIFIDDTHLKKPTKVQVKSTVITSTTGQKYHTAAPGAAAAAQIKGGSYLQKYQTPHQPIQPQFKPLVQVDPSVLSTNRVPLQNPRLGDYQLNKTASTEGIASKKSLELKKRYLLGDPANGNKIQKSGSTSVLDSKIRSFHSNISECQKLLNPGGDISSSMKTFLDRTKLGEHTSDTTNIINRQSTSTTGSILNDLKVEITIQKAASAASTDNEKENIFVNSKNELNKGMEYSETVNTTLVEALSKKSPTTPTPNYHPSIIETIDLVTPEKKAPSIIDLTQVEIPRKMLESNVEFINNVEIDNKLNSTQLMHVADSNKIIDLTLDSPVKNELTLIDDSKPDVSRGVKESIPDIIEDIETTVDIKQSAVSSPHSGDEHQHLLSNNSYDEEKKDSPEKHQHRVEIDEDNDLQIQVPNIPWNIRKTKNCSSISGSSCTSSNTSSIEDIQHYILDSTTSPDTQTAAACIGQVPRLEVHDTAGELMQIDSLMIIDGKYIGDPEDLKLMDIPEGLIIPALPDVKTTEVEDEPDIEPVTSTPEPADRTVIETVNDLEPPPLPEHGPPLPAQGPPIMKPIELKFDTRNENKVESLKNLPLIVDQVNEEQQLNKAIKPITLNLSMAQKPQKSTTPTAVAPARTPLSPLIDNDKTPTAELLSRGSDSETEATGTGTGQVLTETELSDWTADDCISENFIDIEFVLNSNKGTIKRNKNKKAKKKHASFASKLSSGKDGVAECSTNIASVTEFEGILQNLDIDEIEFMDTGSEGSYAEAYSATNTAMLRNRGYIEFIETNASKATPTATSKKISDTTIPPKSTSEKKPAEIITMRDEVLGIDYIEQGAYIMQRDDSQQDLLKTPVNEEPHTGSVDKFKVLPPINSLLSQSLTDSSTLNDDDSLGIITPNSQAQLTTSNSGKSYTKTTTEESEALTVVTSPLDSSSPKLRELVGVNAVSNSNNTGSTPSSSDKNPKTSLSTCTPSSTSTASSSNATSPRRNFSQELVSTGKPSTSTASSNLGPQRNPTDELSYEDYVRALQQKITQISSACGDSFDSRKQRRKSSKGETPIMTNSSDTQTVIEQATNQRGNSSQLQTLPSKLEVEDVSSAIAEQREIAQAHKVPEIPTLSRRLEEITKERTKQKDLIHDLVMDKLQSKKQLNAEKRLHRSRQRTILTSGMSGFGITGSVSINTCGSSLSPTPKLAAASTTTDTNCTNQAHYHVSTASNTVQPALLSSSSSFKEANPPQKSGAYIAAYHRDAALSPTRSTFHKQRPFSEHIGAEQLDALEPYRLTKAPSFSYIMSTSKHNPNNQIKTFKDENTIFSTPVPPQRPNPNHIAISPTSVCNPITASASTDKLRSEARARARLKSNNELGLSPEEKMLLLRKRLNIEDQQQPDKLETKQINARDRKMSTSKSVNDLSTVSQFASQLQSNSAANEYSNTIEKSTIIADFTSDPNLLLSSSSAQTAAKPLKEKSMPSRRQKDPERRKSIIQSLSSFFHMGNSGSNNGGSNKKDSTFNVDAIATAGHSAQPERPGTSGSSTTSGSVDGVFSRFRMSSKTKEKSKENRTPINAATSSPTASTAKTGTKANYERSISQDCILNSKNSNIKHHSHSHHHNINKIIKASTASTYSSSSPQLFITKATAHNAAADNQTPPPIPPLPLHYQRSDDESYATETREQKKQRSISKAIRQAELKRLRIAQEIQREQEEIEVQLKELEARGVLIEKALRGESQPIVETTESITMGASDEKLLKELLDIWRNITQLKKRDEELGIRQQELQLEHRHAQLKEELNIRLSSNKIDKSSSDVAAEGAILNEMLEIVAKRAALRPTTSPTEMEANTNHASSATGGNMNIGMTAAATTRTDSINLLTHGISYENSESNI